MATAHTAEMERLAATTNRNKDGILNSYRYGRANAVAEGTDNSIMITKHRGYGIMKF